MVIPFSSTSGWSLPRKLSRSHSRDTAHCRSEERGRGSGRKIGKIQQRLWSDQRRGDVHAQSEEARLSQEVRQALEHRPRHDMLATFIAQIANTVCMVCRGSGGARGMGMFRRVLLQSPARSHTMHNQPSFFHLRSMHVRAPRCPWRHSHRPHSAADGSGCTATHDDGGLRTIFSRPSFCVRKINHADWSEFVGQVGRETQQALQRCGSSMAFEPGGANNTIVNMRIGNSIGRAYPRMGEI